MKHCSRVFAVILLGCASCPAIFAQSFHLGDSGIAAKLETTVTAGVGIRTSKPDRTLIGTSFRGNGNPKGGIGKDANDAGDLNFDKGDIYSSPLKMFSRLTLTDGSYRMTLSARAWTDVTLETATVPEGNIPNGYAYNHKLSDRGFDALNKFSNVVPWEAYVSGHWAPGDGQLSLSVGRQVLNWSDAVTFLDSARINALDLTALQAPGALLDREIDIPTDILDVKWKASSGLELEGFYQLEQRRDNLPSCGTFFSSVDLGFDSHLGCSGTPLNLFVGVNAEYLPAADAVWDNNAFSVANGEQQVHLPDRSRGQHHQGGLALRYRMDALDLDTSLYFLNLESRVPVLGIRTSTDAVRPPPDPVLLAAGAPVAYATLASYLRTTADFFEYPGNIHTFGVNAATHVFGWRTTAELEYVPNQPVMLSSGDIFSALFDTGPLASRIAGLPPGSTMHGYDRLHNLKFNLNFARVIPDVLHADSLNLFTELEYARVTNLPPLSELRYGRHYDYGASSVGFGGPDACTAITVPDSGNVAGCYNKGFVTSTALAYHLRAALDYQLGHNFTLSPSLLWSHDVTGYSADGQILKKRRNLVAGLDWKWNKEIFGGFAWNHRVGNSTYDFLKDRNTATVFVGANF